MKEKSVSESERIGRKEEEKSAAEEERRRRVSKNAF
jgi:hypothetical protein